MSPLVIRSAQYFNFKGGIEDEDDVGAFSATLNGSFAVSVGSLAKFLKF